MSLAMASIDRSPLNFLPLMKKVGVESTPSFSDGAVAHLLDAVQHLLIRQAGVERLFGEAELFGDSLERLDRLFHHPFALLGEQRLDDRHEFVVAGASRQHEAGCGERIEWKFPEYEAHLAGVDVTLLQFGKGRLPRNARNVGRSSKRIR